jgi:Holliday junction resolvase-like predicted endonuclease
MAGLTAIELGVLGEDLAVGFLERRGMRIVERNAFVDRDEIDIVYESETRLAAVEVKTSSTGADPFDALDDTKMHRFLRAANGYRLPISGVDAIAVMIGQRGIEIRWLRSIGSP